MPTDNASPNDPSNPPLQQEMQKLAQDRLKESNIDLHSSSLAIRRAYVVVFFTYCSLFVVGLGTAIFAIIRGFLATNPAETVPAVLFAALSSHYSLSGP